MKRAAPDRPLTDAKRRALVRSALGPMSYRLDAARVALIADDCAALELDARATFARAALWATACRRALDAGEPLPDALELGALEAVAAAARAAAVQASPNARDDVEPGAAAGAA